MDVHTPDEALKSQTCPQTHCCQLFLEGRAPSRRQTPTHLSRRSMPATKGRQVYNKNQQQIHKHMHDKNRTNWPGRNIKIRTQKKILKKI